MARVFAHNDVVELAKWASVPVINGLSDYTHPCQGLGDMLHGLREVRASLAGVRLAFVGDGSNNVATSLMFGGALTGMEIVICSPGGLRCRQPTRVEAGRKLAAETGANITLMHDPQEAVRGAQAIYTDVWTSMGQEAETEERLKSSRPTRSMPRWSSRRTAPTPSSCTVCRRIAATRSPTRSPTGRSRRSSTRPRTACTPKRPCWRI